MPKLAARDPFPIVGATPGSARRSSRCLEQNRHEYGAKIEKMSHLSAHFSAHMPNLDQGFAHQRLFTHAGLPRTRSNALPVNGPVRLIGRRRSWSV